MPEIRLDRLDPTHEYASSADNEGALGDDGEIHEAAPTVPGIDQASAASSPPKMTMDAAVMRDSFACLDRSWELLRQTTSDHP